MDVFESERLATSTYWRCVDSGAGELGDRLDQHIQFCRLDEHVRRNPNTLHPDLRNADALIMAAAVADYRPAETHASKIKRSSELLSLELSSKSMPSQR